MRHPFDAVAFDGYRVISLSTGQVQMTCVACTDLDATWFYDPSPSNLLEIIQTVRGHNVNCSERRPTPRPPKDVI